MDLAASTFIVTGGASGLGEATARTLLAGGANVVVADLQAERGEALAKDLGAKARFVKCDVTSEADGKAVVDLALKSFGGLQGLVTCAGIAIGEKTIGKDGPHAEYAVTLDAAARARLKDAVRLAYLDGEADGPRSYGATAFAVKGIEPS